MTLSDLARAAGSARAPPRAACCIHAATRRLRRR
ncbi:hypothetical protein ACU4GH_32470 [Bradyrhizobium betae]